MNDGLSLGLAALAGACLGVLFYGGLWWTVKRAVPAGNPAVWFMISGLLRVGIVLAGFWAVGAGRWPRLLAALAGFVSARVAVVAVTRTKATSSLRGSRHAP